MKIEEYCFWTTLHGFTGDKTSLRNYVKDIHDNQRSFKRVNVHFFLGGGGL